MNKLTVVNYADQRVLTTKQLAEIYETEENSIQKNFSRNQRHFIEGKHYFLLEGAELREFKRYLTDSQVVGKRTPRLYLWIERGANCPINPVADHGAMRGFYELIASVLFDVA